MKVDVIRGNSCIIQLLSAVENIFYENRFDDYILMIRNYRLLSWQWINYGELLRLSLSDYKQVHGSYLSDLADGNIIIISVFIFSH